MIVRDVNSPSGTTVSYNAGTMVRISDGMHTSYQMVVNSGDEQGERLLDRVWLAGRVDAVSQADEEVEPVEFDGGRTRIEAWAPFPININTAPIEVLYAVMCNLARYDADDEEGFVTPQLAYRLADRIVRERSGTLKVSDEGGRRQSGPFRHAEDWGRWLERLVRSNEITRLQRDALYINSINSRSALIKFGTAPWCFRSLDVYHVESRIAVNNRVGEQIAEHALRQIVEIGTDAVHVWEVDSQAEFEERLQMGSGAKFVASYPYRVNYRNEATHHIQPAMRAFQHIQTQTYPSDSVSDPEGQEDIGDVRLEPVRLRLPGAHVVEHFDQSTYTNGWYTNHSGAWEQRVDETFQGTDDDYVQPFAMSFWWRPYSDADWTAFDCGLQRHTNRYAIFVSQGVEGQELVFRVAGATREERAAEVYVPLDRMDYEAGNWYHIHVSCVGEDPSTMQLLVDGVDIAQRRGVTRLSGALTPDDTEITVESTEGFPRVGSLQIGNEIIEYENGGGDAFGECFRGARGTTPGDWATGTTVRILGYSLPLLNDVMMGGSYNPEDLGRFSAGRIYGTYGGEEQFPDTLTLDVNGTPLVIGGFAPENENPTIKLAPMWGQDDATMLAAFGSRGIALIGCPQPNFGAAAGAAGPDGEEEPPPVGPEDGDPPTPGGEIPPDLRDPPGSDPGTDPGGDPGSEPGTDPGGDPGSDPGTDPGTDPGSEPGGPVGENPENANIGGWELVSYEKDGDSFVVTRYHASQWQPSAEPYFLMTHIITAQRDFPCFMVPISVLGSADQGVDSYLDAGANQDHENILTRYGGDGSGRVLLNSDIEGEYEVVKYDSIDRETAGGDILFVRDRDLNAIVNHFYGQSVDVAPVGGTDPDDGSDDVPPLPEDEEPPTDPGDPGDPSDPSDPPDPVDPPEPGEEPTDEGGFSGPGGGVPPGLRTPTDDNPDGGDDPADVPDSGTDPGDTPDTGGDPGTGDPGTGDPGTGDPGTGDPGTGDPGTGDPDDGGDPGTDPVEPPEPGEEPTDEGGFSGPGGSIPPNARGGGDSGADVGDDDPPETEPEPDSSGGGEGEEPEEDPDEPLGPGWFRTAGCARADRSADRLRGRGGRGRLGSRRRAGRPRDRAQPAWNARCRRHDRPRALHDPWRRRQERRLDALLPRLGGPQWLAPASHGPQRHHHDRRGRRRWCQLGACRGRRPLGFRPQRLGRAR